MPSRSGPTRYALTRAVSTQSLLSRSTPTQARPARRWRPTPSRSRPLAGPPRAHRSAALHRRAQPQPAAPARAVRRQSRRHPGSTRRWPQPTLLARPRRPRQPAAPASKRVAATAPRSGHRQARSAAARRRRQAAASAAAPIGCERRQRAGVGVGRHRGRFAARARRHPRSLRRPAPSPGYRLQCRRLEPGPRPQQRCIQSSPSRQRCPPTRSGLQVQHTCAGQRAAAASKRKAGAAAPIGHAGAGWLGAAGSGPATITAAWAGLRPSPPR